MIQEMWKDVDLDSVVSQSLRTVMGSQVLSRLVFALMDTLVDKGLLDKDYLLRNVEESMLEQKEVIIEAATKAIRRLHPPNVRDDGELRMVVEKAFYRNLNQVLEDIRRWVNKDV